jgi:PmbA protein
MTMDRGNDILDICRTAVKVAQHNGAKEVSANAYRVREVSVSWRDGKLEKITEATTRGLGMSLYVDGRYSVASTSDLRPGALEIFIQDAIALGRTLAPDPFRALPDPALYANRPAVDLQLEDASYDQMKPEERRRISRELEEGVRAERGSDAILSVSTGFSDSWSESVKVASNGFEGVRYGTSYWVGAEVSVKDADGRRPEDGAYAGARFHSALPDHHVIARDAARRAHGRLGAKKVSSAVLPMALENRVAGRLVGALIGPLAASSLQQKRSFLEGKLGQKIGSDKLTIVDDPLIPRAFGSRLFDGEGISARRMPVFEKGVVSTYFVDTYYGKKLGMAPTTGSASNLTFPGGQGDQASLLADLKEGVLVTGFLGGNTNASTGDFSLGVQGFMVRGGQIAEPIAEMNIAGNQLELWQRLIGVGADPYPYSAVLTPTLVFDAVQFAGL